MYGYPKEFDILRKIGRKNMKTMTHLKNELQEIYKRWESGDQDTVKLTTSSGSMEFNLDMLYTKKRKRGPI